MMLEIGWVCEICYRALPKMDLPANWELVWQSAICHDCQKYAKRRKIGLTQLVCGSRAQGPDPRTRTVQVFMAKQPNS